jgi:hypothetical protein
LGKTVGFGTLHISRSATAALTEAADIRLRHVLGEGANPKLRLVKSSIRKLLEISSNDADELTKHAMSRIVYGNFYERRKSTRNVLKAELCSFMYQKIMMLCRLFLRNF